MSVRCSQGHESPDGSAFCDECGEPLPAATGAPTAVATQAPPVQQVAEPVQSQQAPVGTQTCPSCGAPNPEGDTFCSSCGSSLLAGSVPVEATVPAQPIDQQQPIQAPVAAPAQHGALQARLIVEADNQEFDLSGKDNITIGREDAVSNMYPDVDLTPHGGEEGGVSRLHARIFVENGQYMLEDENSTNFTFLNRQRLSGKTPTPLNDNDEVRLGRVLLRFKTS